MVRYIYWCTISWLLRGELGELDAEAVAREDVHHSDQRLLVLRAVPAFFSQAQCAVRSVSVAFEKRAASITIRRRHAHIAHWRLYCTRQTI